MVEGHVHIIWVQVRLLFRALETYPRILKKLEGKLVNEKSYMDRVLEMVGQLASVQQAKRETVGFNVLDCEEIIESAIDLVDQTERLVRKHKRSE